MSTQISKGPWLQVRTACSFENSLQNLIVTHLCLEFQTHIFLSLENQSCIFSSLVCQSLYHAQAALRDLTCWCLPRPCRPSLVSENTSLCLRYHLIKRLRSPPILAFSTLFPCQVPSEKDSFAFTKPKQNWKRLFMQLFPVLDKVRIDAGSSLRHSLVEMWTGE